MRRQSQPSHSLILFRSPANLKQFSQPRNKEGTELMFGLYKRKMADGYEFAPFEMDEYYGMFAYFHSDKLR
jgi:hypothetical protein